MRKRILLIVLYLSTFVQGWCQGEIYYVENLDASAHYNDGYVLHSLCNWTNDGSVMATGTNMIGWLSAFRHGTAESPCHFLAGLTPLPLRSKDGLSEAYWPRVAIIGGCVISSPTITTHTIINKCR